ncbi:MAG: DUF268 domain-containing protein [Candidatus Omnitrophica bacterium]|nr:DUF268 domain-containing protein [Candidatus Omnitrophota bacterium]
MRTIEFLRGMWHLIQPFIYCRGRKFIRLPKLYINYLRQWRHFAVMGGRADFDELAPCLFDRDPSSQSGGERHYFYQDIWALKKLAALKPDRHNDVGSRLDGFTGQATAICPVIYWDIRSPGFNLPNFEFRKGDILDLALADKSVYSLSCLHVAEHVGLGRYGDSLDPDGTSKALRELMRILAKGGQLLLSMPIGRERVCFNAQRIWHPQKPVDVLDELRLLEFAAVSDGGDFMQGVSPSDFVDANYSCGLYCFTRD